MKLGFYMYFCFMKLTPTKITWFTFFKLPAVFWTGIRVKTITKAHCDVTVKFRWINQNPFKSMFWAVQGMAAELSTGALVMQAIQQRSVSISMLLVSTKAHFHKKARGRIKFTCDEGDKIAKLIEDSLTSGDGKSHWFRSVGIDEEGEMVSEFHFEWSVKPKR